MKKKQIQKICPFNLPKIERDIEKLILKYKDPKLVNLVQAMSVDPANMPKEGFYLMLMSQRDNKIQVRQFGMDVTPDQIIRGFTIVLQNIADGLDTSAMGQG